MSTHRTHFNSRVLPWELMVLNSVVLWVLQYEYNNTPGVSCFRSLQAHMWILSCVLCGVVHFIVLWQLVIYCFILDILHSYIHYVFQHSSTLIYNYSVLFCLAEDRQGTHSMKSSHFPSFCFFTNALKASAFSSSSCLSVPRSQTVIIPACLQPLSSWRRQV